MRAIILKSVVVCVLVLLNISSLRGEATNLQKWKLATKEFTVSGFSAGGSMATQLYLAYSNHIKGVAIFSGLLFHCGEGQEIEFLKLFQCSRGIGNLTKTAAKIKQLSKLNLLDPLDNLATRKHYIEQGRFDHVVRPNSAKVIQAFFRKYSKNVKLVMLPHSHATPTENCGSRCSTPLVPFSGFVNCGYSAAFEGLNYIYGGSMIQPVGTKMTRCNLRDSELSGLIEFNQKEFFPPGVPSVGMADTGFMYIPDGCRKNSSLCRLHVHFHGCLNDAMMQGKQYVKKSEFLAIAEENNFIVIFPQTTFAPTSLSGMFQCWDMIGITEFGTDFWGTKRGRQLGVVYKMIARVLGLAEKASTEKESDKNLIKSLVRVRKTINNLFFVG